MTKKKGKSKLGKALQKVSTVAKKVAKTVTKGAKGIIKIASFPVLLPFKAGMTGILKSKGITPQNDISKLAQQFHSVIIEKKSSYEVYEPEHIAPMVVGSIINAVIGYFKSLKDKKDKGEVLSPAEEKALANAEAVTSQTIEAVKDEATNEVAKKSFMPLIIGAIVALVVIALLVMKSKKK